MFEPLKYRSDFLVEVFEDWIDKNDTVLEIGSGDGRNIRALKSSGYTYVVGIDKKDGAAIEDVDEKPYDTIFTMSTLFLIPPENEWVFKKIARMAKKYIVTIEGETTSDRHGVWGRDYSEVFCPLGFRELYVQRDVFNEYGVLRVLKKDAV